MEELQPIEEIFVQCFAKVLEGVGCVEDMFPPDCGGDREPRQPILPLLPGAEALTFAPVYDLAAARERRRNLVQKSGGMLIRIDELVGAGA